MLYYDNWIALLVHFSTISNVILICKILSKKTKYGVGYILLLHLSVADLIHDTHAYLYDFVTLYLREEFKNGTFSMDTWILQNLYFGYAVSLVSFFAVFATLFRELCDAIRHKYEKPKSFNSIIRDFGVAHGWLWSISLMFLSIIIALGTNCQPIIETEVDSIQPREMYDQPSNGLMCQIPETQIQILEAWKSFVQALTHPLWYPIFCLAFTPFLAFLMIGWEVKGYFKSLRIVGILIPVYFVVFFVDLLQFSVHGDDTNSFTHAKIIELRNQFGHVNRTLHMVYVFHHWSRLMASCLRNVFCIVSIAKGKARRIPSVTILNPDLIKVQ